MQSKSHHLLEVAAQDKLKEAEMKLCFDSINLSTSDVQNLFFSLSKLAVFQRRCKTTKKNSASIFNISFVGI